MACGLVWGKLAPGRIGLIGTFFSALVSFQISSLSNSNLAASGRDTVLEPEIK